MGYLSQVCAGGKQYIYLTEYCGSQPFSRKTGKHIFAFGSSHFALLKMKRWFRKFETEFLEELKEAGYTNEDLKNWLEALETGITKSD